MKLSELYTPCLIVDKPKIMQNLNRMSMQAKTLDVILRPHVKTSKSIPIALLANGGNVGPITVSTLREAEYFAKAGFKDIIYAVSMVPSKLDRAKGLLDRDVDLKLIIDNADVARAISAYGQDFHRIFNVMIEIDVDMHRAGLSPDAPEVLEIAEILHNGEGTECAGVLTHAGESYDCKNDAELIKAAEHERASIVLAADNIKKAGYPCPIISCGSTPTATYTQDLSGVTELRAG
ncbi:MAG: alanine racemase, partial [Emcibacteraceae bacterium]|nr:alanine racemase [Emcibacteraceae bacterium]